MFDTYVTRNGPSRIEVTTHEHRAPTDESVRLLREMESSALEQVLLRLVSGSDNELRGTAVVYSDPSTRDEELVLSFALNGKEYRITDRLPPLWRQRTPKHEWAKLLLKAASEAIAEELLVPAFAEGKIR